MKNVLSGVMAIAFGLVFWTGCSLKENREVCPCRLELDFSRIDTSVVRSAGLVLMSGAGIVVSEELDTVDFRTGVAQDVPKGMINVGVWSGGEAFFDGSGLSIPLGEDCPSVYFHASSVDARNEYVSETVYMRKNYCIMTVVMKNMDSPPENITVSGNVDGYGYDGIPSEGGFRHEIRPGGDRNIIGLPRQKDNSLVMDVNDGSGILKRFAIGEYISACGYDWNEPDLKDLTVEIDVAVTRVTLQIQGWDKVFNFEVVI